MAEFQFEDANGQKYAVEAPDLDQAVTAFKQMAGSAAMKDNTQRSGVLPFSKDLGSGEVSFDPEAGVLGSILRGLTAPGDVVSGNLDPNSPEGVARAMDATGLMLGVNPMVASGDRAVPGVVKALRAGEKPVPSAEALKEASEAGYNAVKTMGVDYSSVAVKDLADDLTRELADQGIIAELTPKTFSILEKLKQPPEDSVASIEGLVAARRALNNAGGDFTNPTERLAANRAIDRLDEFLEGSDPASVVAGPATAASKALEEARGNYAAAKRSDRVTNAEDVAERSAQAAASGLNLDNRRRQVLNSILNKPKERRGYSKEEVALIEEIVRGKFGTNAARWLGNYLGAGGGLASNVASLGTAALGLGVAGDPVGLLAGTIPPIVGTASRSIAGKLTERQIRKLDELIRKRSPLYQNATAPQVPIDAGLRSLMARGLMLGAPANQDKEGLRYRPN
jgi:hypothetical protein